MIVIDQFRGDYLERYRDQFGDAGFRLLLDHGAYFPNCNYNYANTRTAPGHSTLFTGAYSNGHGIVANEWWDQKKKKMVTSVEDDATKLVGVYGRRQNRSLAAQSAGRHARRRTQARHARQIPRFWGVVERPRRRPSRRIRRRCRLLDRPEKRRMDHLHLLPQRPAQVGAGFQFHPPAEILGSRMERRAGNRAALHRASQRQRRLRRRLLRSRRPNHFRQRIRIRVRQRIDGLRKPGPRPGDRPAFDQPLAQRHSRSPGRARFARDAADGARSRPRTRRLHQLSSAIRSAWPTCGSRSRPITAFPRCPMP